MSADVLFTVPWESDGHWHTASYWIDTNGVFDVDGCTYSVDRYSDGDHEDVDADDMPTEKEQKTSWLEYWNHVAWCGEDPLKELGIRHRIDVAEKWEFCFHTRPIGVRRCGKVLELGDVPNYVMSYLGTSGFYSLPDFDFEERARAMGSKWVSYTIHNTRPRAPRTLRRQVLSMARFCIKQLKKELKECLE